MDLDLVYYGVLGSTFVFVAIGAYLVADAGSGGELVRSGIARREEIGSPLLRVLLQIARAIAPLRKGAESTASGRELDRLLRKAGRPFGMTVAEFQSLRYVSLALGLGLGWFGSLAVWSEPSPAMIIALGVFGYVYPMSKLKSFVESRRIAIFRDLPYVLDMLTLSTEAGQDFSSAMATVIDKGSPGPLISEFRIVHQEITLGKRRSEALREMALRIDLPEVTSFVLSLIQAEELGTSIGKVLRIMAEQMRIKRSTIAEELAGKVPVKLMMPLMLLIVPAAFIVLLFGPVYLYITGQRLAP
jgi:tight adherence protein C